MELVRHGCHILGGVTLVDDPPRCRESATPTLYHALPELIVPFDGQVTCGFFDWESLPKLGFPR
jgi:hypothetical protein